MADPLKLKTLLDSLPTSQRVRASIWDAFNEADDLRVKARLDALPIDETTKARLWDAAAAPADDLQVPVPSSWSTFNEQPVTPEPAPRTFNPLGFYGDLATGVGKSLGRSAVGAGQLVAQIPGVAPAVNASYEMAGVPDMDMEQMLADALLQPELTAQGGAQQAGQLAGDIGQFFLGPTGKTTIPRQMLREAAQSGLVSSVQGSDPEGAAIAGGLGAASPVLGKVLAAAPRALRKQALTRTQQFLGGTKERYKAMGEKLAPEVLRRKLGSPFGASREQMLATASVRAQEAGRAVQAMLTASGGTKVATAPLIARLDRLKDAYRVTRQVTGAELVARPDLAAKATQVGPDLFEVLITTDPRPIRQLTKLQTTIADLGPDATVEQVVGLRRAWDEVVDQAGGYAQRAQGAIGVPLKEQSEAWAKREATTAIRRELAKSVPDLATVNQQFSFWKKLEDVLTQTQKRTAPQQGGLGKTVVGAAGFGAGIATGGDAADKAEKAIFYGTLGAGLQRVLTSPRYRLVGAHLRLKLADAIASGDPQRVATALGRVMNAMLAPLQAGESVTR